MIAPEDEEARKIAFENWRTTVDARERVQRHLARELNRALEKKRSVEEEQKRALNDTLVQKWFKRKDQEARKRTPKLQASKNAGQNKKTDKVFKKALSHEEWLTKKNGELKAKKSIIEKRVEAKNSDPRVGKSGFAR
jgi:hypothetical protein